MNHLGANISDIYQLMGKWEKVGLLNESSALNVF